MTRRAKVLRLLVAAMFASAQAFSEPRDPAETIGTATITAEGTIVLDLRSQENDGSIVEARLSFAPGDPEYPVVLRHIGKIAPCETVWVRPFPDERSRDERSRKSAPPR